MDKKGQALVLFIILIPVFFAITAIVVDMGINAYNEKKLRNVTEDVMEILLEDEDLLNVTYENEDEIINNLKKQTIRIYSSNKIDTEYLYIDIIDDGKISITNTNKHYSFMNSLFGKGNGEREISVEAEGQIIDGETIIEFKDGSNEDK